MVTKRSLEETSATNAEAFRLLVSQVKDYGIFLLDPSGHVTSWNDGAQRTNGFDADEIVGQHFSRFYPPEERETGKPNTDLETAGKKGKFEETGWRVRKDGNRYWATVVITPLKDEDGKLVGFGAVTRDLTPQKKVEDQLRRSEERFRSLVSQIKDFSIVLLDPSGHVSSWNEGAERIKGYSASEIMGQHVSKFYTPEDNHANKPATELETAEREGRCEDIGWRLRKDGSRFWANVVVSAVLDDDGALTGFAEVTRDLTEHRKQQEAILELSTPVLQVRDGLLILPIIGVLDSRRAQQLTEALLTGIRKNRARVIVLDVTGVPLVDSRVANHLVQTIDAARLMGSVAILSGLSPDIAQTVVTLGIDLSKIRTVSDLQVGIEEGERLLGYRVTRSRDVTQSPGLADEGF